MNIEKLKKAIVNPPPERLAGVEYRSHFLQIIGISIVCIILLFKGYWYVIFAFIFGIGVSYAAGISAYQKYLMIKKLNPHVLPEILQDPSPTRRRSRIIEEKLGNNIKWLTSIIAIILASLFINPAIAEWYGQLAFVLLIFFFWGLVYFFPTYWIAYILFKHDSKMKGGKKNEEKKRRRT